jgi:RNA polymerase sigma-70 factor (ECF subfamily)
MDRPDLLLRERSRVRAFLARLAGGRRVGGADVEDLCQETWLRAWRSRASLDGRPPLHWLLKTAFRVFLDHRARTLREHERTAAAPAPEPAAPEADRASVLDLEQALAALAPLERRILTGFHRDGRSIDELARELGIPRNTVKSHLHRARQRLAAGDRDEA